MLIRIRSIKVLLLFDLLLLLLLMLLLLLLLFNQSKKKVAPEGATVVFHLGFRSLLGSVPRDVVERHPSHRNVRHLRL